MGNFRCCEFETRLSGHSPAEQTWTLKNRIWWIFARSVEKPGFHSKHSETRKCHVGMCTKLFLMEIFHV